MSDDKRPSLLFLGLASFWCPGLGFLMIGKIGKGVLAALAMFVAMFFHFFIARFSPAGYLIGLVIFFAVYLVPVWLTIIDAKKVSFATPKKIGLGVKILFFVIVLGGLLIIRRHKTWLPGENYLQSSAGLYPAIRTGEQVYFDQLAFHFQEPKRGDIVLFTTQRSGKVIFSKRIIGLPGDQIAWIAGELSVNNVKANRAFESAVSEQDEKTLFSGSEDGKHSIYRERLADGSYEIVLGETGIDTADREAVTVPEGKYYVLGDHRNASNDSRAMGFISKQDLIGKAAYILWPRAQGQRIDWSRLGKVPQ